MKSASQVKKHVAEFWSRASCGEDLYLTSDEARGYHDQAVERYRLEPYVLEFMEPWRWDGKDVLEIGVGLGADHQAFAEAGARLSGVDLTERAVEHTTRRLGFFGLSSTLQVADAENLPFHDNSFDLVYSWGVIHHTPDTPKAATEILRILRPGGTFKVMIYYKWSLIGLMLWVRYGLMKGRPFMSLAKIYSNYLESPGTKAYTLEEAAALFPGIVDLRQEVVLTHGDLLDSQAGQRHSGVLLRVVRKLWPRQLLRKIARSNGLFLLIEGTKPADDAVSS